MARNKSDLLKTIGLSFCLVVSIFFQLADAHADERKARDYYISGYEQFSEQNWRSAADFFSKSYREEKHSLTAIMLAGTLHELGNASETRKYALEALRVAPPLEGPQENWASNLVSWADEVLAQPRDFSASGKADDLNVGASAGVSSAVPPLNSRLARRERQRLSGVFTIQQKSNGRYLDAHESPAQDYGLVTRPKQNNDTQRWVFEAM